MPSPQPPFADNTMTAASAAEPRVLVPLAIERRAPALGACVHRLRGRSMGTSWELRFAGAAGRPLAPVQRAVEDELALVVAQMSAWEPGSDLCRYNAAVAGQWQTLPAEFCTVLDCALQVAAASDGAFDPAAGALVELWGFGPGRRYDAPDFTSPAAAEVAAARARGGWRRLQFDATARRLRQPGGLQLDFSAIAKGYAVDRVCERLRAEGIDDLLVEVGGELRGHGIKPDGQPWWVELAQPPAAADAAGALPPTRIALHGLAVATSGDYLRCFRGADGRLRPHSIDPRSGEPIAHGLASVSVLHAQCMRADALSTALTVLGPIDGPAFAARHGIAALFQWRRADGTLAECASPALAELAA